MRKRLVAAIGGTALLVCAAGVSALAAAGGPSGLGPRSAPRAASVEPLPGVVLLEHSPFAAASVPTTSQCEQRFGLACYGATQFEKAYDEGPLFKKGLDGAGETIAIVDPYGSPTIQADLATFDSDFSLPAPPSFTIITPAGAVPTWNPKKFPYQPLWAGETSLDVEYAHAMAPGANILLVETPVPETIGVRGFPEIAKAENYVIAHHLADVISQSFGAAEASFPSSASLLALRSPYVNALQHHVTVVSGAGDDGASAPSDASGSTVYTDRAPMWPASDPLVTSVGGTQLHLNNGGTRVAPDNVWNDTNELGSPAAGGGGDSSVFSPRPSWQDGVEGIVHDHRGYPDVSMSAAIDGGPLIEESFPGTQAGLYLVGGTSLAAPLFAGIVAIADQAAGHPLGLLNPPLYTLGEAHAKGIVDVTAGNSTISFIQKGRQYTVPGYVAAKGYDLASGLGTVDAAKLVAELAG